MSYRINKTNGELLVELADGTIDTSSSDITLVGRNFRGFGELFNENFVKLAENFASTRSPDNPLQGQLWYDTNQERLKLYNGVEFRPASGAVVSPTQPLLIEGDIWIDNRNKQLYFFDGNPGNQPTLVGPVFTQQQGTSGIQVRSVLDANGKEQVIVKFFVGNDLIYVLAKETFRLAGRNRIEQYPTDPDDQVVPPRQLLKQGLNTVDPGFQFRGNAETANALVDSQGNIRTGSNFLPADANGTTIGTLTVLNSGGISTGIDNTVFTRLRNVGTRTVLEARQSQTDMVLRTRQGNTSIDSVFIKGTNSNVGINTAQPTEMLDVNGNLRVRQNAVIDGNLTINGDTTFINAETVRILDKNIELGLLGDETLGDDNDVDEAGLIIRSSDGDKTWLWDKDNNALTSNVNIDLEQGNEYFINGQSVLSRTELGSTVTTASGLTSIGTLTSLSVDNLSLDANTISSITGDIVLNPANNTLNLSNSEIIGLNEPSTSSSAATKNYVDTVNRSSNVALSLDVTGLDSPTTANPYVSVQQILETISPASEKENGVLARINVVDYNNAEVSGIDVADTADKSFVSVLSDDGTSSESVLQDIAFSDAQGNVNLTPNRQTMIFEVVDNAWVWVTTN